MVEFDKSKTHDENIKVSIEKILESPAVLKKKKKTAQDHKKIRFIRIIEQLEALDVRVYNLDHAFFLDLNSYEDLFYDVIADLFSYVFNSNQIRMINFYLYERIAEDGHHVDLFDDIGQIVKLNTPEDLYNEVLKWK